MKMSKRFFELCHEYLIPELEQHGFVYFTKERMFIRFCNGICQSLTFEIAGYGSRIELLVNMTVPEAEKEFVFPPDVWNNGLNFNTIQNPQWIIKESELPEGMLLDDDLLLSYQQEIIKIYNDYIRYIFCIFDSITDFFQHLYTLKPKHKDVESFVTAQQEMMQKNLPLIKQLKKEFNFVDQYCKTTYHPVDEKTFYKQGGEAVCNFIVQQGFDFNKRELLFQNKLIFTRQIDESRKIIIKGEIQYGLFVGFIVENEQGYLLDEIQRYSNPFFCYGWLVADSSKLEKNILLAMEALKQHLEKLEIGVR